MELKKNYGAREALRQKMSSQRLTSFSSSWNVGDKVSVFYPIRWVEEEDGSGYWDLVVAMLYGHKVTDIQNFPVGNSFIPSLTEIDEDGSPVGTPDIAYQFSHIAPLFIKGKKQKEINKLMEKNFQGKEDMRSQLILDIENRYDTSKTMDPKYRPIIGKLTMLVTTELVSVPISDDDKYLTDKANIYTQELSSERLRMLIEVLENPMYAPQDKTQKWLEVKYTFSGTRNDKAGKAEAGRKATPTGLTREYTMQVRNPEAFEAVKSRLRSLPEDSILISKRNFSFRKVSEQAVKHAINQYVTLNSEYLDEFVTDGKDHEEDLKILERNAELLTKMDVMSFFDSKLQARVKAAYEKDHPEDVVEETPVYEEPKFENMPTATELLQNADKYGLPEDDEDIIM